MNPKGKHGLRMVVTCQCRDISDNKCIPLPRDVDNGEARNGCTRDYMEPLCVPSNFAVNLKLHLKIILKTK